MEVIKHGTLRRLAAPACMLALAAGTAVCGAAAYGPSFWPGAAVWAGGFTASPGAGMKAAQALADAAQQAQPAQGAAQEKPSSSGAAQSVAPAGAGQQAEQMPATEDTANAESSAQSGPQLAVDEFDVPQGDIPEGMLPLIYKFYPQGTGSGYIPCGNATIRNATELPDSEVAAEVNGPLPFSIELDSDQPQVLIMHTHATETYELAEKNWCDPSFSARSTDNSRNMIAVGAEMARVLNEAGINTIQDTTLHDYPSYNGSYEKSNATVRSYLEQHPSIKVVLDVHRDAIQTQDGTRYAPAANINGMRAAQVMIICGADVDGNLPNFKQNLRFAARWQAEMAQLYPGLARPVLFDYRYYNQDLTTGSLLIEMGGHANTLEEAKYSARLVGDALATLFRKG